MNRSLVCVGLVAASVGCGKSHHGFEAAGGDAGGGLPSFGDAGVASDECLSASASASSVGCEYYAVDMDGAFAANNGCFVVYVVNDNPLPAHFQVSFDDAPIDLATYAKIPSGTGLTLTYDPYDPSAGLASGQVAIFFLAGLPSPGTPTDDAWVPVPCPVAPARSTLNQMHGTAMGRAFHILANEPVVAYQMLPYGGGHAAVTGATLLLPTNVYGTNYVAVNAYSDGIADETSNSGGPSLDVVAVNDGTHVTVRPRVDISAYGGLPGVPAGAAQTYTLNHGEFLQITQPKELTGSPIQSDGPVGLFAGHPCVNVPSNAPYCDHAEQQIPPISALGNEYTGVVYRQRTSTPENPPWRVIGVVDGTTLTWDPPVGGPSVVNLSDIVEFSTATPFNVKSQDVQHPFLLMQTMTGATSVGGQTETGYGDADVVRTVAVAQYMNDYVFLSDPSYPETNLVVVRAKGQAGFSDVSLDCAGTLKGWQPVGSGGAYEYTRIDLVRHSFEPQGGCDNGRHEMQSPGPFGLTVWGWGTTETQPTTGYVSYGYAAGEAVGQLNTVVVSTQ